MKPKFLGFLLTFLFYKGFAQWSGCSGLNTPICDTIEEQDNVHMIENGAGGISYKGTTIFCEWLTEHYNVGPKRKFKKGTFRLFKQQSCFGFFLIS